MRTGLCSVGGVPVFELHHLDLEPELSRQVGHPRVGFDPEHLAADRLELPGGDACTGVDVEKVGPGLVISRDGLRARLRQARPAGFRS